MFTIYTNTLFTVLNSMIYALTHLKTYIYIYVDIDIDR